MSIDKLIAEAHSAITRTKGKEYAPTVAEIQAWLDKKKSTVEISNRRAIFSELAHYDHLSKPDDFIEVTEWSNGEGYDVEIASSPGSKFQLTHGQFEAMKDLIYKLEKAEEDEQ
jgi:hypothetical protein